MTGGELRAKGIERRPGRSGNGYHRGVHEPERKAFGDFRTRLLEVDQLSGEFHLAVTALLAEYDTTIRENRFTVGGAVEHIVGSAMRAAGVPVFNRGKTSEGSDLTLPTGEGLSVKASFTESPADVRLLNVLGDATERLWTFPTLLVVGGLGVGYVDPDLLPGAARGSGDAVILPAGKYLPFLRANSAWLAEVEVPVKRKGGTTKVASYAVAEEILSRDDFELLRRNRTSVAPGYPPA